MRQFIDSMVDSPPAKNNNKISAETNKKYTHIRTQITGSFARNSFILKKKKEVNPVIICASSDLPFDVLLESVSF